MPTPIEVEIKLVLVEIHCGEPPAAMFRVEKSLKGAGEPFAIEHKILRLEDILTIVGLTNGEIFNG